MPDNPSIPVLMEWPITGALDLHLFQPNEAGETCCRPIWTRAGSGASCRSGSSAARARPVGKETPFDGYLISRMDEPCPSIRLVIE